MSIFNRISLFILGVFLVSFASGILTNIDARPICPNPILTILDEFQQSGKYIPEIVSFQLIQEWKEAFQSGNFDESKRLQMRIEYLINHFREASSQCTNSSLDDTTRIRHCIFDGKLPTQNPTGIFLGGGTASGKSTISPKMEKVLTTSNYVLIDADAIMFQLSGYQEAVETDRCAASRFHEKASSLAELFFNESIKSHYSFVLDGTMKSGPSSIDKIRRARASGTNVWLFGVTVATASAANRAAARATLSGRWVPLSVIAASHSGFSLNWPQYLSEVNSSQIYLFDTDPVIEFPIIYKGEVRDKASYNTFLSKSHETLIDIQNELLPDLRDSYAILACECDKNNLDPQFLCPSTQGISTTSYILTSILKGQGVVIWTSPILRGNTTFISASMACSSLGNPAYGLAGLDFFIEGIYATTVTLYYNRADQHLTLPTIPILGTAGKRLEIRLATAANIAKRGNVSSGICGLPWIDYNDTIYLWGS